VSEDLCIAIGLPASRVWYVTGRAEQDAFTARASGLQAIFLDPDGAPEGTNGTRGVHRVRAIEEILDVLRGPYTRSVLNLRYIMRSVLRFDEPAKES
jgi:hypothetical protein